MSERSTISHFYLVTVNGRSAGCRIRISGGGFLIGRDQACHLRPKSARVSRRHCRIVVQDDSASVEDLNSRTGTYLNGQLIRGIHPLRHGDNLGVGPLTFMFEQERLVPACEDAGAILADGPAVPDSVGGTVQNLFDSVHLKDSGSRLDSDNALRYLMNP